MKKRLCAFIVLIILCSFVGCQKQDTADLKSVVATVNGNEVTAEELNYYTQKLRSKVAKFYIDSYGEEFSQDTWTKVINGKTPSQELQEQAMQEVVRSKVILTLAKEKGIYQDISFESLKKRAENYNANSYSHNVGLKTINMYEFYTYYIENATLELQNKMTATELNVPETEKIALVQKILNTKTDLSQTEAESIAESQLVETYFFEAIEKLVEEAEICVF